MRRPVQRDDSSAPSHTRAERSVTVALTTVVLRAARTVLWFVGLLSLVLVLTAGVIAEGIFARAARRCRMDRPRVQAGQRPRTQARVLRSAQRSRPA